MSLVAPFAAVESLIDQSIGQMLSNVVAVYSPKAGRIRSVLGIFDATAEVVDGDFLTTAPVLDVLASDVPEISQGDKFTFNGVIYTVKNPGLNGTGRRQIQLGRVEPA